MYGSAKATKPKNIGVKHYTEKECAILEVDTIFRNDRSMFWNAIKRASEELNNTKEDLK